MFFREKINYLNILSNWKFLILIAIFNSIQVVTYFYALKNGDATYVLAIKRTSVLMLLVIGFIFFKEGKLRERFIAASLMFIGVLCISFSKI
jgi:uncharacterized membrane protein